MGCECRCALLVGHDQMQNVVQYSEVDLGGELVAQYPKTYYWELSLRSGFFIVIERNGLEILKVSTNV